MHTTKITLFILYLFSKTTTKQFNNHWMSIFIITYNLFNILNQKPLDITYYNKTQFFYLNFISFGFKIYFGSVAVLARLVARKPGAIGKLNYRKPPKTKTENTEIEITANISGFLIFLKMKSRKKS
jgi:hypothetical protein